MKDCIYEMPCLTKYRFSDKGDCIHHRKGTPIKVEYSPTGSGSYHIRDDDGLYVRIQLKEIIAYVKHLKQVEQYNPLNYHHYVVYRPILRRNKKAVKDRVARGRVKPIADPVADL